MNVCVYCSTRLIDIVCRLPEFLKLEFIRVSTFQGENTVLKLTIECYRKLVGPTCVSLKESVQSFNLED